MAAMTTNKLLDLIKQALIIGAILAVFRVALARVGGPLAPLAAHL